MKKINFTKLKSILSHLTPLNRNRSTISELHTSTPFYSKRFTRCENCGKKYQQFQDPCCELKPIPKQKSSEPTPQKKQKKLQQCSGGMMEPCLEEAYKHKCKSKFKTCDCPPLPPPACPKGDWNRGDP